MLVSSLENGTLKGCPLALYSLIEKKNISIFYISPSTRGDVEAKKKQHPDQNFSSDFRMLDSKMVEGDPVLRMEKGCFRTVLYHGLMIIMATEWKRRATV